MNAAELDTTHINKQLSSMRKVLRQPQKIEQLIDLALEEVGHLLIGPPIITSTWRDFSHALHIELKGQGDYDTLCTLPETMVSAVQAAASFYFKANLLSLSVDITAPLPDEDKLFLRSLGKIQVHYSAPHQYEALVCGDLMPF